MIKDAIIVIMIIIIIIRIAIMNLEINLYLELSFVNAQEATRAPPHQNGTGRDETPARIGQPGNAPLPQIEPAQRDNDEPVTVSAAIAPITAITEIAVSKQIDNAIAKVITEKSPSSMKKPTTTAAEVSSAQLNTF